MNANDWIPLVDKLAEWLGVASSEVAQAVEVLAADYGVVLGIVLGLAVSVVAWRIRLRRFV